MRDLEEFLKVFEPYAKKYFAQKVKSATKYAPLISQFYRDLTDFNLGGKRMRAFLVFLGWQIGKPVNLQQILPICLAVELLHSFLLIHDDIIDKSDTRHLKPTVHKRYEEKFGTHYGMSQAIVLGDIACFDSFELVINSSFDQKLKLLCLAQMVKVLTETGYGEALDVLYSYQNAGLSDIRQIADLKTARYSFVGPLTIGAILGGLSQNKILAIEQFGLRVGLAFQIKDDILGVFGDQKVTGKPILSDMREGKNTFLILQARKWSNRQNDASSEMLAGWGNLKSGNKELREIREEIKDSGALSWCEEEMAKLISDSKKYIPVITEDLKIAKIFREIADFVTNRVA